METLVTTNRELAEGALVKPEKKKPYEKPYRRDHAVSGWGKWTTMCGARIPNSAQRQGFAGGGYADLSRMMVIDPEQDFYAVNAFLVDCQLCQQALLNILHQRAQSTESAS